MPSEAELAQRLEGSPSVVRWRTELAQRQARRDSARTERIPDLALRAGPRRLSGPGETAFVVDVSLPLPLWDRSRGAIAETEYRLAKLSAQGRAARVRAVTSSSLREWPVGGLGGDATASHPSPARHREGRSGAAPRLRARALRAARGARRGASPVAARAEYLRALIEAHHSAEQIERLTGVPLEVRP